MHGKSISLIGLLVGVLVSGQGTAVADVKKARAAIIRGDFPTAFREFKEDAEKGNPLAQAAVGVMLHIGQGVKQNLHEAFSWYRKAAENGYAAGQANVGIMYYKGAGVPQNDVQAYAWLDLASHTRGGREHNAKAHVAKYLSKAQLQEAQRLALEYRKKYLKK
jgi:TPR repeat protein